MANETSPKPHKNIRGAEYFAQSIKETKVQTPLDRLREFVGWAKLNKLCESTYDFESQCGLSNRYISNSAANGKGNIGAEILGRIVKQYPMLNLVWICNGEGSMTGEDSELEKKYRDLCRQVAINADYKKAYELAIKQIEVLNNIILKSKET